MIYIGNTNKGTESNILKLIATIAHGVAILLPSASALYLHVGRVDRQNIFMHNTIT